MVFFVSSKHPASLYHTPNCHKTLLHFLLVARMAVWCTYFQTLPIHIVSGKCYQMSSFSETKAHELIKNSAKDFAMYNARQFCRIYPSGTRTGSSNFKPTPMWNVGCHMGVLSGLLNKWLTLLLSWKEFVALVGYNSITKLQEVGPVIGPTCNKCYDQD